MDCLYNNGVYILAFNRYQYWSNIMNQINNIIVAFSATSIHKKLAMYALDYAARNKAKLFILEIRDKNIAEKVAKLAHNHGFLGEKVVEKLKADIKADRDELISKRLKQMEKESEKRGIKFETITVKGSFIEEIIQAACKYKIDAILMEDMGKASGELKKNAPCEVIVVE